MKCSVSKSIPSTAAQTEPDDDVVTETALAQKRLAEMALSGLQVLPEEIKGGHIGGALLQVRQDWPFILGILQR